MTTHASDLLEHLLTLVDAAFIDHLLVELPHLTVTERIDFIVELHPHLVVVLRAL